ncbi:MAG: hypothetical protein JSV80_04615 [Acidobacteriota bacterium]|nr:MAG: hypothetical protein JSV80_04615 [Acidobacteriota bacterium]
MSKKSAAPPWAPWVIRGIGVWILAGALLKLLLGTPADLPVIFQQLPLGLDLTYRFVITMELALAALALFRPDWAWPLLVATLAVFVVIVFVLLFTGASSCGCFGSKIKAPPWLMLPIDGALLAALLAARPWRGMAHSRAGLAAPALTFSLAVSLGAALAAPWMVNRQAVALPDAASSALPRYVVLTPEDWTGTPLAQTPLARWLDLSVLPETGLYTFYRQSCEHCAEHLFELAATDDARRSIVLIRIFEPADSDQQRMVDVLPEGDHVSHASLPASVDWVLTTPADIELEDGIVVSARQGIN